MRGEVEQLLDEPFYATAELGLRRQWVIQEETTHRQQSPLHGQPAAGRQQRAGLGPDVEPTHGFGPTGQAGVMRVQRLDFTDVPQQVRPAALLEATVRLYAT